MAENPTVQRTLISVPVDPAEDGPADERFAPAANDETIRRERGIARALRATAWWRRKRAKGLCHYCGGHFKPTDLTMDHLVPLIRGGRSVRANIVPCCKPCNYAKKNRLTLEWHPEDTPLHAERSLTPS